MSPGTRAEHGFTLLELLMAVMLLALLTAGAFGAIRTATRAVARGEAQVDRTNQLRVAQEFLRRQIAQTLAMPFRFDAATNRPYVFVGAAQELTYVAPMPGYLGRGGPYVQKLTLEQGPEGLQLVFHHALLNGFDPDAPFPEQPGPVVLLQGITEGRFEYRGLDETGKLGDWTDAWDQPGPSPLLVRVQLTFAPEANLRWPELVMPLMVDPTASSMLNAPSFFFRP